VTEANAVDVWTPFASYMSFVCNVVRHVVVRRS